MNSPKKLHPEAFARAFVTRQLAQQLPPEAIQSALDAGTLWKGLRAEYALYAQHQDAVIIRADDAAQMLPEGVWAGLNPEKRKHLRRLINDEAKVQRQTLAAVMRFIDAQCASIEAGSPAFKEAYAARFQEYFTQPIADSCHESH